MKESQYIELKRELTKDLEKEVVAFLNYKNGGVLYIGIDKNGKTVGLNNADEDALKTKDRLKHNISPSILGLFDIRLEEKEGKTILKIVIASGPEKPYFISKYSTTSKGCFIRIGTASEPMNQSMIDELYASRTRNALVKIQSPKQRLQFSELKIYYIEKNKRLNEQFAANLELIIESHLFNYNAYLLADVNTTSFKLAKYAGTDRSTLLENEEYGNRCIITAAKKLLDKLDIENKTYSTIQKDRNDTRLWNQEALREAVRNAFVHNDYSRETFPKFEIFSDRIEMTTYGGLPMGLSEKEFFEGYSVPRNKVLMRIFRDLGLVENLGYGIPKILETYNENCFEFSEHFLRIRFPKNKEIELSAVIGFDKLTNRQIDVLQLIVNNNEITYQELSDVLKINRSAIQKHIKALKDIGSLNREGTKEGSWEISYKEEVVK